MLFMNLAKFTSRTVYMEEQGAEGGVASAAPTGAEPSAGGAEPAKPSATEPAKSEPAAVEPADNGMQSYIDQYAEEKPALSLALGFLRDNGISPEDAAFSMAEKDGDFTLLKALLASKGAPGTDQMVAILEGAVGEHFAAVEAHEAETEKVVGEILGEQQEEILQWARDNADDTEKEAFNDMFEAGGVYARAAAMLLQNAFSGAGNTIAASNPVSTSVPSTGGQGPMSRQEYTDAVDALSQKYGDPRSAPEYASLSRRREMGRARGI